MLAGQRRWSRIEDGLEVVVAVYSNFLFATLARPWVEKGKAVDRLGISASTNSDPYARTAQGCRATDYSHDNATRGSGWQPEEQSTRRGADAMRRPRPSTTSSRAPCFIRTLVREG